MGVVCSGGMLCVRCGGDGCGVGSVVCDGCGV